MIEKSYSVRLFQYDDDFVHYVKAYDTEEACEKAVEYWYIRSHWTGSPPDPVECEIRERGDDEDDDGEVPTTGWERVDVGVRYSPAFHAYRVRPR